MNHHEAARRKLGFSAVQACRLAGITYRQLDYWARSDLLRPSAAEAAGSGSARRYSALDVRILRVVSQLGTYVSVPAVRRSGIVEHLRALTEEEWAEGALVLTGDGTCTVTVTPMAVMAERGLSMAMVVNLAAVPEPTHADLHEEVLTR